MIHTIISWDCSFRNIFHLIDGLLSQEYARNEFELIYVEQRTKQVADAYNHKLGLKSLWDRYEEVKNKMNIRVVYLGDDPSIPYHLGRCNNKGIELAKGQIISVMDGDMLLPANFLSLLEKYHSNKIAVGNLFRHSAQYPIDVRKNRWTEQKLEIEKCLEACETKNEPLPKYVNNKGPLVSALKEIWVSVDGYDEHRIWSTGLSRLGQDVNTRIEVRTGTKSSTIPHTFAVHPYHPSGFIRASKKSKKLLELQLKIINWSKQNNEYSLHNRKKYTQSIFNKNREFIEKMIYSDALISKGEERSIFNKILISGVEAYSKMRKYV